MNNKEKIIKFLEMKNEIIEKEIHIKYIFEEDIQDVKSWSNKECNKVYTYITDAIYNEKVYGLGFATCPWCIIYKDRGCLYCGYCKRYGKCGDKDSLYNRYRSLHLIEESLNNEAYSNILKKIEKSE